MIARLLAAVRCALQEAGRIGQALERLASTQDKLYRLQARSLSVTCPEEDCGYAKHKQYFYATEATGWKCPNCGKVLWVP